jgi:hypothetical protein
MLTAQFPRVLVATLLLAAARAVSAQEPLALTPDVSTQQPIATPGLSAQESLAGPPDAVPPLKPAAVVQGAEFRLALYEGFDRLLATDTSPTPLTDPRFRQDTGLSSVSGTLAYTRHSRDVEFAIAGGGNARYYTVVPDLIPVDVFANSSVSSKFTRRTRVHASGSVSYSPYYSFGNFLQPSGTAPVLTAPTTEQTIARLDTKSYSASAGLTWAPKRKTTVEFTYTGSFVDTDAFTYRYFDQGVNAKLAHRTSRYSTFHAGYGVRETQLSGFSRRIRIHNIDVGFGYQRPLSFSRHTVIAFNVGSSVIDDAAYSTFVVTGGASLVHQLTRRWSTGVYYRRDVDAFAGALNVFVTDNVYGSLTGMFTPKLSFSANGGYTVGRLANGVTNGYQSYSGGPRLSYLASRYLPIYVEYVFYHYEFDQGVGLAPGFPLLTTRHGLRAGLSYNVPLMGRRTR